MRDVKYLLVLVAILLGGKAAANGQGDVVWYDGEHPVTYEVVGHVDPVVRLALRMFCGDIEQVTGQRPVAVKGGTVRVIQRRGTDDGFRMSIDDRGRIVVEGHNARGTAYGLLELSRMAGVSPWVWWGDVVPAHSSRLALRRDFVVDHTPSVDYRGIFINDEDWSIRRWKVPSDGCTIGNDISASSLTDSGDGEQGRMGPLKYRRLFELMLRLRANTLWPAMHEGTEGFFTVPGNKSLADSFSIVIGTSHCEPLLRNNVAEWDVKQRGPYNYITNGQAVRQYWAERLREVRGSKALFTLGMRGIHDGSMEGVKTPEEKLNGLQMVIDDQRKLLRNHYSKDVESVPQVFIPYKEVLEIMESGLRVPDDVALMWCDDNYGYLTRLPDSIQQRRRGGGGVYYHLSYWGRPHDYLWLTTTQPGLIYHQMRSAYDHNCRRLWIANVHDPKVAAYQLELFLDMAWDINSVSDSTVSVASVGRHEKLTVADHLKQWLVTQFGGVVGNAVFPVMKEYYRLCAVRRPEFMGWTQVELDKKRFPGGKSVPSQTEFSLAEAYARMNDFARIEATVDVYSHLVRDHRQDAYFAHVLYPVHAAAAMTRKMLLGSVDSLECRRAFDEIQSLTARYNSLGSGKWQYLMSAAPRALPVFGEVYTALPQHPTPGLITARNACDYQQVRATVQPRIIPMLGHSMQAVDLPRGATLVYDFDCRYSGDATLYTALVPTQPAGRGDLRYQVVIDEGQPIVISLKEPYRSEQWKLNVLRAQALKKTTITLTPGSHRLYIKALDDGIVFDQWMIHTSASPAFYEIPVRRSCEK